MLYFSMKCSADAEMMKQAQKALKKKGSKKHELIQNLNQKLKDENTSDDCWLFCTNIEKNTVNLIAGIKAELFRESDKSGTDKKVAYILSDIFGLPMDVASEEITVEGFMKQLDAAEHDDYLAERRHRIADTLHTDYFENNQYSVKQEIVKERSFQKSEAMKEAKSLMSASCMLEELERIYAPENPKKFYGHPVHYMITSAGMEAGYRMVTLLVKSLIANGRLPGGRIDKITGIRDCCYDEQDVRDLMQNAIGNTVVIETRGCYDFGESNLASAYESVVEFYDGLIEERNRDVLFIFIVDPEHPGFSKSLMAKVTGYLDLVELTEGRGSKKEAKKYLDSLIRSSELAEYADKAKKGIILDQEEYTATQIHKLFGRWSMECLRYSVYTSYAGRKKVVEKQAVSRAQEELDNLIGLDRVKSLVKEIIAANVVNKRRAEATSKGFTMSRHMIFTGNPGSAKTTVARAIADTLKEEGVLKTGAFVECGRADLVGRYVGWTDKTVREQFRKASGGILFIDEAYALVDDTNSYGDEAINTIVQEMENRRDDVIVIFAGYPDKMEQFLQKNEGLRSRISFHLNFPDYGVDELMKIFEKMMRDKEYEITDKAKSKVEGILREGSRRPDFGNGRFVRNVLEQAMMKQSVRLYQEYKGKEIPKQVLLLLEADDIDPMTVLSTGTIKKQPIGF